MTKPSEIIKKVVHEFESEGFTSEIIDLAVKNKVYQILDEVTEDVDRLKGMVTGLYLKNALEVQNQVHMTSLFKKREWEI